MGYGASRLEGLVMFDGVYSGTRVFVTGDTGFKGSWLCLWLQHLGAEVCGYALEPETDPAHAALLPLSYKTEIGDIRNAEQLRRAIADFQPEVVFHMAAQPLVRRSYAAPLETIHTNVLGTANLFEACRHVDSVRSIVNITSDKCYENREWVWGYRENDPMGGYDPYSASKGCAELVTASWRNAFFPLHHYGDTHQTLIASARAGNVIGGGDWSQDRLIPDMVRAIEADKPVVIRNPQATRPWQHVLEPLSGYLFLGQKLLQGHTDYAEAWNFGPADEGSITVGEVVRQFKANWDAFTYELYKDAHQQPHEAGLLKLDCSKARAKLNWQPVWDASQALEKTAAWYRALYTQNTIQSEENLNAYVQDARRSGLDWARG